jgi:hypothetical protein
MKAAVQVWGRPPWSVLRSDVNRSTMLDFLGMPRASAKRLECGSLLPPSRASSRPKAPASRTHSKGFAQSSTLTAFPAAEAI